FQLPEVPAQAEAPRFTDPVKLHRELEVTMRAALAVTVFVFLALAAMLWWPGEGPAATPPEGDAPAGANEAVDDAAAAAPSVERPTAAAGIPAREPAREPVGGAPGNVRVVA